MATLKEKLPSFTEQVVPPLKVRQLVTLLERRLDSLQRDIEEVAETGGGGGGGGGTSTDIRDHEMAFFLGR